MRVRPKNIDGQPVLGFEMRALGDNCNGYFALKRQSFPVVFRREIDRLNGDFRQNLLNSLSMIFMVVANEYAVKPGNVFTV